MQIDGVHSISFAIFQRTELTVRGIAGGWFPAHDLSSQLLELVFDFVLLLDVRDIQLVVMILEGSIGNAVKRHPERQCLGPVRMDRWPFVFLFKVSHKDPSLLKKNKNVLMSFRRVTSAIDSPGQDWQEPALPAAALLHQLHKSGNG